MLNIPIFSLMLDESTDHSLEKHFMVYATFLDSKGLGPPISQFLKLINVFDGRGKKTYDAINDLMEARGLSNERLIGVSTNGASSMVGSENGFVTFLEKDIPNLVGVHCIAHHEALATSDASKSILELLLLRNWKIKYMLGCKIQQKEIVNLLFYNNLCNLKLFMLFKSMDLDGSQGDKLLKGLLY